MLSELHPSQNFNIACVAPSVESQDLCSPLVVQNFFFNYYMTHDIMHSVRLPWQQKIIVLYPIVAVQHIIIVLV